MTQPSTVPWLSSDAGVDASAEKLRWMLLTWDLASPDTDWYSRLLITETHALSLGGKRTPEAFGTVRKVSPHRQNLTLSRVSTLEAAEVSTKEYLAGDYAWVCRPLAVDLSGYAGTTVDGAEFSCASDLLSFVLRNGPGVQHVVTGINRARAAAMATHADPLWATNFPDTTLTQLWEGR